jgi:hypothetical protein
MKIEFDVDPNMVRFIVLALLITCGVNYEKIMVLAGI